jgi:branched-chain amino acid transport system permease protein
VFVVLGGLGNILGSVISATILYILPEAMKMLANGNMSPALLKIAEFVEEYRMIVYSIILIVLMICTWSPKVKNAIGTIAVTIKEKFSKNKEEVSGDE